MDEIKQGHQGAEQKAEETKAKSKAAKSGPDPEELVDLSVPLDPKGELRDLVLGVNGELIRVKRGCTVKVKRKFVEVYQNSVAQNMAAVAAKEKAQRAAEAPMTRM